MSEVDPNQMMFEGIDRFWTSFIKSPLGQPSTLQTVGLSSYTGGSGFGSWDGMGDFFGGSHVQLHREDGAKFMWTLGVLYEQGSNDGKFWQQGCAYAYAAVTPNEEEGSVALYDIGDVQLPARPLKLVDLPGFSRDIARLAEQCLDDLRFVYQARLFDELLVLGQRRLHGHENWKSNPLRSNYYA